MTLIGRVGQDPAIRGSEEKPVTLFQLATSQSFKSPEGACLSVMYTMGHQA